MPDGWLPPPAQLDGHGQLRKDGNLPHHTAHQVDDWHSWIMCLMPVACKSNALHGNMSRSQTPQSSCCSIGFHLIPSSH